MENTILAANIKTFRAKKAWSQQHLAEVCDVTLRTIQRAEAGEGVNAESLLAIAGAFDVTADELRFDALGFVAAHLGVPRDTLTPELAAERIREQVKQVTDNHLFFDIKDVKSAGDLDEAYPAPLLFFNVAGDLQDAHRDIAAELNAFL